MSSSCVRLWDEKRVAVLELLANNGKNDNDCEDACMQHGVTRHYEECHTLK